MLTVFINKFFTVIIYKHNYKDHSLFYIKLKKALKFFFLKYYSFLVKV